MLRPPMGPEFWKSLQKIIRIWHTYLYISIYIQLKIRQVCATKMIIPEHMIQSNPVVLIIKKEVGPVELCTYIHSRI
jgi:hypothetical protein